MESAAPAPRPRRSPGAAFAVGLGIFLSRVAGLVRQRVFGHYLGLSPAADAFTAALRIPNFLQNLFGEGILSGSFIPVYAKLLAEGDEEGASRVASAVASLLVLIVSGLTIIGIAAAPAIVAVVAPGFQGEVRQLTVSLVEIMFPGVGLLVLAAWCLGVLNSHRRFFLSYVAPVLWNAAIIAALVVFGHEMLRDDLIRWRQYRLAERVAWGTVVGAGLQLGLLAPSALRLIGRYRPTLALDFAPLRTVLRNFVPVLLSRGVVQISAFIDQALATLIGSGANAAMAYAQTIYLVPVSLFGMSVSAAELPAMAGVTGSADEVAAHLRPRLETALRRIAFFVIPSVVALLALGDVVVGALYQTGAFRRDGTLFVWMILAGSTIGLLATTQSRLYTSAFYALHDPRTPLRFATLRVALTAVGGGLAAFLAIRRILPVEWGTAALAASAGLAGWLEFLLLGRALRRRIGSFTVVDERFFRIWAAALLAGGVGFVLHRALPPLHPIPSALLVLGLFGAVYLGLCWLMGFFEGSKR